MPRSVRLRRGRHSDTSDCKPTKAALRSNFGTSGLRWYEWGRTSVRTDEDRCASALLGSHSFRLRMDAAGAVDPAAEFPARPPGAHSDPQLLRGIGPGA